MRMERIDLDVAQIRAIVEAERQKAGTAAVLFGMWQGDRELLTVALGNSMTTVPATTDMHYRIGGSRKRSSPRW
jgi:D-alanyl-D-alanine carboxypeptidase